MESEELEESAKKKHSPQQIEEYARYLGMKLPEESQLLWIAEEGLDAPVAAPWVTQKDHEDYIYYFNTETQQKTYEHPMDKVY